jgi:hypothetical protein
MDGTLKEPPPNRFRLCPMKVLHPASTDLEASGVEIEKLAKSMDFTMAYAHKKILFPEFSRRYFLRFP